MDWIEEQRRIVGCSNPVLLEKAIVALQLVGHLVEAGLPFQFKGGSSLLLIVDPIRRLSIDADIVTQALPDEFDRILQSVAHLPPFNGIEHDPRRDKALPPKKHFRAHYPTNFPQRDGHVLLDVLFETAHAAGPTLIQTPFIRPLTGGSRPSSQRQRVARRQAHSLRTEYNWHSSTPGSRGRRRQAAIRRQRAI